MSGAERIALVGAGRMGQAVLAGLLASGRDPATIVASARSQSTLDAVQGAYGVAVAPAADAVAGADVVIVAVKPYDVVALLDALHEHLAPGVLVISLAVGLSTARLAEHLPPGVQVVRVMPNTPALVGEGMSVLSAGPTTTTAALALAHDLMASVGRVREIPESLQDAATAVSGSGPAYLFYVVEAMIDTGVMLGLPRELARDLAVQTIVGAGQMLARTGQHPSTLRENVTSPGGTTAAALHVLDEAAVRAAFARAMRACRDRAAELGR